MFSLDHTKARLNSLNARAEKHGEDRVPAFDLKFSVKVPNTELIEFDSELRQFLYKQDDQPDLLMDDDDSDKDALTALRFPELGPLAWEWEAVGYTLILDYGMGEKSNIILDNCEVNKFTFTPETGGTVEIAFRVQCHAANGDVGKLCEFIQRDAVISLSPPDMNAQLAA